MDKEEIRQIETFVPNKVVKQAYKVSAALNKSVKRFERRNRVNTGTIILMLCVAGFYDFLQFLFNFIIIDLGLLSFLVGVFSYLTFYTWNSWNGWNMGDTAIKGGLNYLSKTDMFAKYILPIIGLIPWLNELPEITLGVFLTILIVKSDDYVYNITKGRTDERVIKEGIEFFNILRDTYNV
ncbi:MAG: hypothetical protein ABL917_01780 [Parcubacteria group bacterium]